MAIGAGGRFATAGRHGLAMHAFLDVLGRLVVAPTARLRQPGEVQG